MIEGLRKVVFFGAHADDEMICAGTLHRLAKGGTEVQVVTAGPAATAQDRTGNVESWDIVQREWRQSLNLIGAGKSRFLSVMPSADFQPHRQRVCQAVYDICEAEKPDAVFILSPEDENTAHSVMGIECERVMRGRVPWTIRCQFPWNYGLGRPNLYVSLSDADLACKAQVIETYKSQHFRYRYGEMLLAQAVADGLSVKVAAAEKFEIVRGVL